MKEHFIFVLKVTADGGNPTEHTDEEGLVDQFVAFWIDQVKLEKQAPPLLPFLMAVLQKTWKAGTNT